MSAYIVSDDVINVIVNFCHNEAKRGQSGNMFWCIRPILQADYTVETQIGCKKLGEAMFALNCNSIEQRYGKGQAKEFRELDYAYKPKPPHRKMQVLKSLRCFIYQCSEGDINEETNELYRVLYRLSLEIALHLITRTAQYESAVW